MQRWFLFGLVALIVVHTFESSKISMHSLFGQRHFNILRNGFRGLFASSSAAIVEKPNVIFVLGGPGAGKGTQCKKLAQEFNIKHLSAGELLREEQLKPTEDGRLIDAFLKEGKIVPVEISLGLLKKAIVDMKWNRYLIDGFPRNWDNLEGWNKTMADVCNVESVLVIDCQQKELEKRIISRGESSGRDDDNLDSLKKRFATFKNETLPVINHFKTYLSDRTVIVNGDESVDKVYEDLKVPVRSAITRDVEALSKKTINRKNEQGGTVEYQETRKVMFVDGAVYISCRVEITDTEGWTKINFEDYVWQFKDGKWTCTPFYDD